MTDTIDFEIIKIRNMDGKKPTVVEMRIFGKVSGWPIDEVTVLVAPETITTFNKLSEHIFSCVLQPKMNVTATMVSEGLVVREG